MAATIRTRNQVIAVVMLATALAADRAVAAAPMLQPPIAQTARWVADRFSRTFCQVVPASRMPEVRQARRAPAEPDQHAINQALVHQTHEGHFRFRLPPPTR